MSDKLPLKDSLFTLTVYCFSMTLVATLRKTIIGEEYLNGLDIKNGQSCILVTWHGSTFFPIVRMRNRGIWSIISTSRDGDKQNQLFHRLGYQSVRGSTSARGAIESVLAMKRELKKGGILALTPDGPRGPKGVVHPGAIYLAQKAGCPVVPAGISAWPRKQLSTWDGYIIPMPFSHAVQLYGPPIDIPKDLDEAGREIYAKYVGECIHALHVQAEAMAKGAPLIKTAAPFGPLPELPVREGKAAKSTEASLLAG